MSTITDLTASVAAEDTVIDGALVLIQGLQAQIAAIPTTDPATATAINNLVADITAQTAKLTAAVAVNTPSTPPVTPTTPIITPAAALTASTAAVTANPVTVAPVVASAPVTK